MKKTLLSLLFAGALALTGSAFGKTTPVELYKSIVSSEPRIASDYDFIRIYASTRKIKSDKGYELEVAANEGEDNPDGNGEKSLSFRIRDDNTTFRIYDIKLDGFNRNDNLSISHKFKNGNRFFMDLQGKEKGEYKIEAYLFDEKDTIYSKIFVDSTKLGWIERKIIEEKSKPILNLGERLYQDMLDSAQKGKAADLPYEDVKKALDDVEKILPLIKSGKKEANSALLKLADSYIKQAEQRSKQLKKMEGKKWTHKNNST